MLSYLVVHELLGMCALFQAAHSVEGREALQAHIVPVEEVAHGMVLV